MGFLCIDLNPMVRRPIGSLGWICRHTPYCEFQVKEIDGDDVLFIQEDKMNPFEDNRLMFTLLSHA